MIRPIGHRTGLLILVLIISVIPYFINLGASSLWDTSEAFYAETPREMIESGNFTDPTFNYEPRLNKPPLSYWIVAVSYRLFGVSEKSERIPIAIGAMIMMATGFALGRACASVQAGLISAIALAANPRFLLFSRRIIIDVYLAVFLGLALLFFLLAASPGQAKRPGRRRLYLVMMYAAIGLAFLTKGPVALVLPSLIFVTHLWITKNLTFLRMALVPAGLLIVAAIVLPWYVSIYMSHGWSYISAFLVGDNFSRYTAGTFGQVRSPFFYLPVLLGDLFPWSFLLLPAVAITAFPAVGRSCRKLLERTRIVGSDTERGESRESTSRLENLRLTGGPNTLLVLWIALVVVFFSFSRGKEGLYILPIYSAAMAIVGVLLGRFIEERRGPGPLAWGVTAAAGALGAVGCAGLYLRGTLPANMRLSGIAPICMVAICGSALILLAVGLKRRFLAVLTMMLVVIAANWIIVLRLLPDFERFQPVPVIAEIIKGRAGNKVRVCYFKYIAPSLVYYLHRGVYEYSDDDREKVQGLLASAKEVY